MSFEIVWYSLPRVHSAMLESQWLQSLLSSYVHHRQADGARGTSSQGMSSLRCSRALRLACYSLECVMITDLASWSEVGLEHHCSFPSNLHLNTAKCRRNLQCFVLRMVVRYLWPKT